jgi:PTS system nitrogen regulatory IIA component
VAAFSLPIVRHEKTPGRSKSNTAPETGHCCDATACAQSSLKRQARQGRGFTNDCFVCYTTQRRINALLWRSGSTMNRLAAILPAANVLVDVDATSKKRVFEHAGLLFENQHTLARGLVTDNLFARERLGSTGLGHGVAIPHGRIKGLKTPLAAVLRVRQPIPFDAPDDEAVGLLIFLLVPEAATQRHLEIFSEIAEMLSDRELRDRLKTEADAAQVHALISRWEPLQSVA